MENYSRPDKLYLIPMRQKMKGTIILKGQTQTTSNLVFSWTAGTEPLILFTMDTQCLFR